MAEPGMVSPVVDYHDRVRWGPIFAGIFMAIATQLVLSALGIAIGLTTNAAITQPGDVGFGVGIWSIISLLIALFVGGWVMARTCGPMHKSTGLLNAAILWATTLAISSWLLATGVSGAFGIVAANAGELAARAPAGGAGTTGITPTEARAIADNVAQGAWWFIFGSLLGLIAAMVGGAVGARTPRYRSNP